MTNGRVSARVTSRPGIPAGACVIAPVPRNPYGIIRLAGVTAGPAARARSEGELRSAARVLAAAAAAPGHAPFPAPPPFPPVEGPQ
ncbi:hypothetical protein [Streptomyces sp. NPDC090036]|uniref:hypothetical protein n=1 Tax=Streptomyces sp. NPDC090036 TaxID=3365926 RepID=UPI00380E3B06